MFDTGSDVEMRVDEGTVEVVLGERGVGVFGEIGSNRKDMRGELLIEAVKEGADMVHFGIDGILQFFQSIKRQLNLSERKVKDIPLINNSGVFGLNQVGVVFEFVVAFAFEIVVEGKNVSRLNVLNVE